MEETTTTPKAAIAILAIPITIDGIIIAVLVYTMPKNPKTIQEKKIIRYS